MHVQTFLAFKQWSLIYVFQKAIFKAGFKNAKDFQMISCLRNPVNCTWVCTGWDSKISWNMN